MLDTCPLQDDGFTHISSVSAKVSACKQMHATKAVRHGHPAGRLTSACQQGPVAVMLSASTLSRAVIPFLRLPPHRLSIRRWDSANWRCCVCNATHRAWDATRYNATQDGATAYTRTQACTHACTHTRSSIWQRSATFQIGSRLLCVFPECAVDLQCGLAECIELESMKGQGVQLLNMHELISRRRTKARERKKQDGWMGWGYSRGFARTSGLAHVSPP